MDQTIRSLKQLGAAIRRQRRHLGLSQADLADRAGLRQGTISTLEKGDGAQIGTILQVIAALDLEITIRPRTRSNPYELEALF